MTPRTSVVKTADGELEVIGIAGVGELTITAVACGKFSAFDKLGYPVEQMQLRGYGKSVVTTKAPSELSSYVKDIDSVLAKSTKKTVLFGYSHGGYFTTMYALGNPEKVSALILVEPALYTAREDLLDRAKMIAAGKQDEAIERVLRYMEPSVGLNSTAAQHATKEIMSNVNDAARLADEFRVRAENPVTDENLAHLKMPVLLIGGTASQVGFMVKRAAQSIPFASVSWVRGATHLRLQDDTYAEQIGSTINDFLKTVH